MYMENIKEIVEAQKQRIKRRNQPLSYDNLWVKVNLATFRDEYMADIGARAFGVFMVIRSFMGKEYISYPSLRTLAKKTKLSITTIQSDIKILEDHGWIHISTPKRKNGRYQNNIYKILQTDLIRGTNQPDFITEPILKRTNGE